MSSMFENLVKFAVEHKGMVRIFQPNSDNCFCAMLVSFDVSSDSLVEGLQGDYFDFLSQQMTDRPNYPFALGRSLDEAAKIILEALQTLQAEVVDWKKVIDQQTLCMIEMLAVLKLTVR